MIDWMGVCTNRFFYVYILNQLICSLWKKVNRQTLKAFISNTSFVYSTTTKVLNKILNILNLSFL